MSVKIRTIYSGLLAISFFLTGVPGFAVVPVNTINNRSVIQGGTYYNIPGDVTAFRNTTGSGLWLQSGTTLRGLEVIDSSGKLTNNGGTIQLYAPGSVIRLDGRVARVHCCTPAP